MILLVAEITPIKLLTDRFYATVLLIVPTQAAEQGKGDLALLLTEVRADWYARMYSINGCMHALRVYVCMLATSLKTRPDV